MSNLPRVLVIVGTSRPGNYTAKAASLVVDELRKSGEAESVVLYAEELTLPFPGQTVDGSDAPMLQEAVADAAGIVLATPEYHGTFAAALKLIIENMGFPSRLSGKPVALLGVAAGRIGAIKSLEHLRSVCSHTGAIVLPGPISIAGVQRLFEDDGTCNDPATEKAVRGVATSLTDYLRDHVCPLYNLESMARDTA